MILRPETAEAKIDSILESLGKPVAKQGGSIGETERWGKRRLAYPIKHATEGIYILFKFSSLPSVARSLTTDLRISEEVLRYMLISLN